MKLSELDDNTLKEYCGIDEDTGLLEVYKGAAKAFIKENTILKTNEDIDKHEDVTLAYMVLVNDMSLNRDYVVNRESLNPTVEKILSLYSAHLVSGGDSE